jgi:hypothetical protein
MLEETGFHEWHHSWLGTSPHRYCRIHICRTQSGQSRRRIKARGTYNYSLGCMRPPATHTTTPVTALSPSSRFALASVGHITVSGILLYRAIGDKFSERNLILADDLVLGICHAPVLEVSGVRFARLSWDSEHCVREHSPQGPQP